MQSVKISKIEAGQRLDKFLQKYLNQAPKSFVYKMLRKKNITLNGKKADGSEKIEIADEITLFLSDETVEKFRKQDGFLSEQPAFAGDNPGLEGAIKKQEVDKPVHFVEPEMNFKENILYEDSHVLILNKPAGILSQKARIEDFSLIEYITEYLLETNFLTHETLRTFHPGISNRLDRNTSGIIVAGKTTEGLQMMGELFKNRTLDKYYYCLVKGVVKHEELIEGYLQKNHSHNRVTIHHELVEDADYIKTQYMPVADNGEITLLKVKLITGKSHQIRAHLQSVGHSIVGDGKYGDVHMNKNFRKKFKLKHQLLHAGELVFPKMDGKMEALSEKRILAPLPDYFQKIVRECFAKGDKLCRLGIQED